MKLQKSYGYGVYQKNMWVSAAHIPGTQSTEADSFSRNFIEAIEWKLSTHLFQNIETH